MDDDTASDDFNVRSKGYFIARASITCGSCRAPTRVLAVVLPSFHEMLAVDSESAEEGGAEVWERAPHCALLFYVDALPDSVRRRMAFESRGYRRDYSAAAQSTYFANHCEACDALIEDHDLICEPEGAFVLLEAAQAGAIEFLRVSEGFEAAAAGYVVDPPFVGPRLEK